MLFLYFGLLRLIKRSPGSKLRSTRRARREVNEVARQHCLNAKVFRFDSVHINPERLWFIGIKTKTDEERERFRFDSGLHQQLREALLRAGYPISVVRLVFFIFESQQNSRPRLWRKLVPCYEVTRFDHTDLQGLH